MLSAITAPVPNGIERIRQLTGHKRSKGLLKVE